MFTRRRLLLLSGVVALAVLSAGAWYVWTKGFTRSWRAKIASEFDKQGIELSLRRLTLDPYRGLVAQEVRLLDVRDHRRVLAVIDEMLLGVNYAAALRGEAFLESVDMREAHLSLPLDAAHPERGTIEISRLNARLFLPPGQIYLARAEAEVFGIQVYASGRLINPQGFTGGPGAEPEMRAQLAQLAGVLNSLRYRGAPPVLSLEFSGDLQKPREIAVDARFYAEAAKRKNYTLSQVAAVASYRDGVLELHQLGATDGKGQLRGSATYEPATGRLSARLQSSLALNDLARAYATKPLPAQLILTSPPRLDLSLEGLIARRYDWRVFGHVEVERFAVRGVAFRSLATDVSWSGGRWSLRDFHLLHLSGGVDGDAMLVPGDFQLKVHGSINPRAFSPVLNTALTEWLGRFEFLDSPTLELELKGAAPTLEECAGTGQIHFGRALYDGQPTPEYTAELRYGAGALSLSPFQPPSGDQPGTDLIYDLRTREVRLEKRSTGQAPSVPPDGLTAAKNP